VKPKRSSEIEFMYAPMPTTITAGVTTYSIVSATPVVNPPHGPIAERAPACRRSVRFSK
jgi:hypothetical protein